MSLTPCPNFRHHLKALPAPGGHIGIELPSGVKLTVDAGVDVEALARVVAVLTR
jgi:transposase